MRLPSVLLYLILGVVVLSDKLNQASQLRHIDLHHVIRHQLSVFLLACTLRDVDLSVLLAEVKTPKEIVREV